MSAVYEVVRRFVRSGYGARLWCSICAAALTAVFVLAFLWHMLAVFLGAQGIYVIGMLVSVAVTIAISSTLRSALHASEKNAAELMDAFMRSQRDLEELDQSYRARLHDARSAAASVGCALEVLNQRASARRGEDRKLQRLLTTELGRLQDLLDPTVTEPFADFDLAEVLEPIVLANRNMGIRIHHELPAVRVHGRRHATASVLDNLLRNARLHAPRAQVDIQVIADDEFAVVIVDDDGPGIPQDECDQVLLPGIRGSAATAPGSGLGLHIAATAMAQQAGTLRVTQRPGRGTRVAFALPIACAHLDRLAPLTPLHPLAS